MAKTYVGIDIGSNQLKLAVCSGGAVRRTLTEPVPDNLVRDGLIVSPEAMIELLKKTAGGARLGTRNCAVALPAQAVFTQTLTLPVMTEEQLNINLPYEFRDFISQEKDKYFYDYAVTDTLRGEDGQPNEFEYIAAATLKNTIRSYADILRKAGLRLEIALPEEMALINIIRNFEARRGESGLEYCFIDLGHTTTRIFLFRGVKHQATRFIDMGMQLLDRAIAEEMNIDEHIANMRKRANTSDVLTGAACTAIYASISVEILRAINFYRFNTPDSNLTGVFLCGGGANIAPLANRIVADIGMPAYRVWDLLPGADDRDGVIDSLVAIGATL